MTISVTLAYPPSTNRLTRMANGIAYKPSEVKAWCKEAAWRLQAAGAKPLVGDVAVAVALHPKATKKGVAYARRIDLDNAIKAALDACQGVVFDNDRQVVRLHAVVSFPLNKGGLTVMAWELNDPAPNLEPYWETA